MSKRAWVLIVVVVAVAATAVGAAEREGPHQSAAGTAAPGEAVVVVLNDGSRLVGVVVREDETALTVRTTSGLEMVLPRGTVARVEPAAQGPVSSTATPGAEFTDPNGTRLMFAPSGRRLRKGDGYFSDHYVIFPGFAYGLTDHWSVSGGVSIVPGLSLGEQVFYASSSVGWSLGKDTAVSLGGLYASASTESEAGAMLFGVASFGPSDRSLSVGLGLAALREDEPRFDARGYYVGSEYRWRWRDAPIVMLGGTLRVGRRLSLVGESWLFPGRDFRLSEQPLGLALRFFGERLSVDVGVVIVADVLDEGFPIPWLSFSYHFGSSRNGSKARTRPGWTAGLQRPTRAPALPAYTRR